MLLNSCKQKVRIDYPCTWEYKVIGKDEQSLRRAIAEIVQGRECLVSHSNRSSSGKYLCLNVELMVLNDEDRTSNHVALKNHPQVIMVL